MKKLFTLSTAIIILGMSFTSCKKKIENTVKDLKANVPYIDMDLFKQKIDSAFGPNTTGYGWAAFKDGSAIGSGANGWARLQGVDADPVKYTPNTVSTIFSTSKTITAACALAEMRKKNISVNTKFVEYIPERWSFGNAGGVSMKDLLAHKSGFIGTFDGITAMKIELAKGLDTTYGANVYANINYTLYRIIIPFMQDKTAMNVLMLLGNDDDLVDECAKRYEGAVKQYLGQAGIPYVNNINTNYWPGEKKTLYYNQSNIGPGLTMFDCHDVSGAGGWFMTPAQYAYFIDRLMADKIVEKQDLDLMKNEELGMYQFGGKNGTYYWHNGGGQWDNSGRGGGCIWMYFPVNNMSFFIQYNSQKSPAFPANDRQLIAKLFDESYVPLK